MLTSQQYFGCEPCSQDLRGPTSEFARSGILQDGSARPTRCSGQSVDVSMIRASPRETSLHTQRDYEFARINF